MLPVLVAGVVFGVGTVIGQKYGEDVIIPAAKQALDEFRTEWNAFSDICKENWDEAVEECKREDEKGD